MLSIGAVPKPELSHQAQAGLKIPEHRADIAIISDPDRGVNFADTLVIDVTITAATSTLTQAAAGPTTKDKETAGDGRATGKAAAEKAKGKDRLLRCTLQQPAEGQHLPLCAGDAAFPACAGHCGRLLLCEIGRLQAEYADERRRAAKYPSYASLGVRTRRLIERVSATLQFGNSTLMLRYLQDCPPRF